MRIAVAVVLALTSLVVSAEPQDATLDGIVTDAAALPDAGSLRLFGSAGTFGTAEGVAGSLGLQWSILRSLAVNVAGVMETGQIYNKLGAANAVFLLRWQALTQERYGINLQGTVRFKTVGFDPSAGEVELGLAFGREIGALNLTGNFVGGHDVDPNGGEDIEGRVQVDYAVASRVNVGVEGRFRTGRDPVNFPEFGSAWDVIAGPRALVRLGFVRIQGLVGYGGGQGPSGQLFGLGKPSPVGMLSLAADVL